MNICSIKDCENNKRALGFCNKHYIRFKKYGDPLFQKVESHGMYRTTTYKTWRSMKERVLNPLNSNFKNYGGRGITICDEWKNSFLAFYRDMGPRPSKNHSIDRIDNEKGYSKENCRWATKTEQSRNQRVCSRNKSGIKGVHWVEKIKKWHVKISTNEGRLFLGEFQNLKDAINERKKAELKYWNI